MAFSPVAARPAGLLVVALDTLRDIVVDHIAHIGLVDPHAEGDGGHHHIDVFHQEHVLVFGAGFGIEPGVIGDSADTVHLEHLGQLFDALAAQAIDNPRFPGMLPHKTDDVAVHVLGLGPHLVKEVRAVEGSLEHIGIGDTQVFNDVFLYLRGGRGRKGDNGNAVSEPVDDGPQIAVLGAEVVPPLRNAVGLVHGHER